MMTERLGGRHPVPYSVTDPDDGEIFAGYCEDLLNIAQYTAQFEPVVFSDKSNWTGSH